MIFKNNKSSENDIDRDKNGPKNPKPNNLNPKKEKTNYSLFSQKQIDANSIKEQIYKIYQNHLKHKNISQTEESLFDFMKDKFTNYKDNSISTVPVSINEEGSIALEISFFWIMYFNIILNKTQSDSASRTEAFFNLFNHATECCEEKQELIEYFHNFVRKHVSKQEIIKRIKENISNKYIDSRVIINFTKITETDYKYLNKNYKFFECDKSAINPSNKKKKTFKDENLVKIKMIPDYFKDVKDHNRNSVTLNTTSNQISKSMNFEIVSVAELELLNESNSIRNHLNREILKVQDFTLSSYNLNYDKISLIKKSDEKHKILFILSSFSFTISPDMKGKKRINFVNNYEHDQFPMTNMDIKRENYLDVTIWKKMEIIQESTTYDYSKIKFSQLSNCENTDESDNNSYCSNNSDEEITQPNIQNLKKTKGKNFKNSKS